VTTDALFPRVELPNDPGPAPFYHIPQAIVLDFDRTLADSDHCMQRLYTAVNSVEDVSLNVDEMKAAQKQVEATGGTFDPLTYIQRVLTDKAQYQMFCDRFAHTDGPQVLYEDARRFLRKLQETDIPHTVLTFGDNMEWQSLKLEAANYPVSRQILPDTNKGARIEKMRGSDGTFYFYVEHGGAATYQADSIVLIDDKAAAFRELPDDCTGYKIVRGEELPSQKGELPKRVQIIRSLDELTVRNGKVEIGKPGSLDGVSQQFARRWKQYNPAELGRRVPEDQRIAVYTSFIPETPAAT
jgi:hypothetical protein